MELCSALCGSLDGRGLEENGHMCMYGWVPSVFTWNYHINLLYPNSGLPRGLSGKESACQCRRHGFDLWVRKIPWRRKWQRTPVFLPGRSHGQGKLAGCISWGCGVGHDWATEHDMIPQYKIKSFFFFKARGFYQLGNKKWLKKDSSLVDVPNDNFLILWLLSWFFFDNYFL